MNFPPIKGVEYIKANDPVMSKIMDTLKPRVISQRENYFVSLVQSIISQQLSTKAASTIYRRLVDLVKNDVSPDSIAILTSTSLRAIGISNQKSKFILGLAELLRSNESYFDNLSHLDDEAVVMELTKINGIVEWTAEMFLIFSLRRLNVLPLRDVGVQRAMMKYYRLRKKPSERKMKFIASKWGIYKSIGSIYLWYALDNNLEL